MTYKVRGINARDVEDYFYRVLEREEDMTVRRVKRLPDGKIKLETLHSSGKADYVLFTGKSFDVWWGQRNKLGGEK